MRCVIGFVLFVALYFGSCQVLGQAATVRARANDPRHSQVAAQAVGFQTVKKYHALVAVVVGVVTLTGCSLPWLLVKLSEKNQWNGYSEELGGNEARPADRRHVVAFAAERRWNGTHEPGD